MKRGPIIAIDGPVAAGKSTIARLVAARLGLRHLESGAMYRAVAWQAERLGLSEQDPEAVAACCQELKLRVESGPEGETRVFVGGREVTREIRDPRIGRLASRLSELPEVRRQLVALQRKLGEGGGIVVEGRDIQTVVFPDADLKIFLTASLSERARRRWLDLQSAQGRAIGRWCPRHPDGSASGGASKFGPSLEEVRVEIEARDARDRQRRDSPLRAAADAITVSTDGLEIEESVARILDLARQRLGLSAGC